ncbi:MAG: hypothetical protein PVF97_11140 [Desulfobacterales bacterium]
MAAILICCLALMACGKKHVGTQVDTTLPRWCQWQGADRDCHFWVGHLLFESQIKKGPQAGTYTITGTVDPTSSTEQRLAKNWQGRFSMFVAKDNIVVDNVGFLPKRNSDNSDPKLSFEIDYSRPEGFDAITFGYEITVGPVR